MLCEKNKIKQSAMCCIYCGKSYKTKMNLDKHLVLCEITNISKRQRGTKSDNDNDIDNDYHNLIENTSSSIGINNNTSTKKLYEIVMHLALKCNKLEHKVSDLSKYVSKQNKKIDVLAYLNTNTSDKISLVFENITELVIVEQSDIEFLFHNNFMDTMNSILSRSIYNNNTNMMLPIAGFTQKANTIYVYTKNNNPISSSSSSCQTPYWTVITRESFIRFMNIIQCKISKALSEWRKKNIQLLNESDSQCILYDKTFSKLMDLDFKIEKTYNKFYNNMYNKIKISIN
jgi:hypothetical protein